MKFIIPQNYNFKNKLFGIIEYSTLFFNVILDTLVFILINLFISNNNIKIFVFIVLCLPFLLFSIVGYNDESIFNILKYIFKYFYNNKLYFYSK